MLGFLWQQLFGIGKSKKGVEGKQHSSFVIAEDLHQKKRARADSQVIASDVRLIKYPRHSMTSQRQLFSAIDGADVQQISLRDEEFVPIPKSCLSPRQLGVVETETKRILAVKSLSILRGKACAESSPYTQADSLHLHGSGHLGSGLDSARKSVTLQFSGHRGLMAARRSSDEEERARQVQEKALQAKQNRLKDEADAQAAEAERKISE